MRNKTGLTMLWAVIGLIGGLALYFLYSSPHQEPRKHESHESTQPFSPEGLGVPGAVITTSPPAYTKAPAPMPLRRPPENTTGNITYHSDKITEWEAKYPRLFAQHPELKELLSNQLRDKWAELIRILSEELPNGGMEIITYFVGAGGTPYNDSIHNALSKNKVMVINVLSGFLSYPEPEMKRGSLFILERMNANEMIPTAINLLADLDAGVRKAAISYLTALNATTAWYKISECLTDSAPEVRGEAIYALGVLRAKESIPKLILSLSDQQKQIRLSAVETLAELDAKEAIPGMRKLLDDLDKDVRQTAILTLAGLGDKELIPQMVKQLTDADKENCLIALNALRALNAREAIPEIRKLLSSPNETIRKTAEDLINDLGKTKD